MRELRGGFVAGSSPCRFSHEKGHKQESGHPHKPRILLLLLLLRSTTVIAPPISACDDKCRCHSRNAEGPAMRAHFCWNRCSHRWLLRHRLRSSWQTHAMCASDTAGKRARIPSKASSGRSNKDIQQHSAALSSILSTCLLPMHRRFRNMFFTTVDSQRGRQPTPQKKQLNSSQLILQFATENSAHRVVLPSCYCSLLSLSQSLSFSPSLSLTSKLSPMENTVSPLPLCQT
jgi:hypothetical protein